MQAVEVRGRFVWHQLLTRDVAGAKSFYTRLVGWKAEPWPLDPAYTVCRAGDVPAAGMTAMTPDVPAEAPPHWLPYIGTRDVDGTASAAVRGGGSIIEAPKDMKGAGRYAVLRDPQGALFAIIDPENARPEPDTPPLATFSWHELATTDHEAAFAFYRTLFGWSALMRLDMGGSAGIYLIFGDGQRQRGGIYTKSAEFPGPAHWLPYAHVRNVDDASRESVEAGAKIVQQPMDVPGGGRIAILVDPQGAAVAIHSQAAEAASTIAVETDSAPPAANVVGESPLARSRRTRSPSKAARPKAKAKTRARTQARTQTRTRNNTKRKRAASASSSRAKRAPSRKTRQAAAKRKKSAPARKAARTRTTASRGTPRKKAVSGVQRRTSTTRVVRRKK